MKNTKNYFIFMICIACMSICMVSCQRIQAVTSVETVVIPSPTVSSHDTDHAFLVLVNFENRVSEERPDGLVKQYDVFGDEVLLSVPDGSINETAALAAKEMFEDALADGVPQYLLTGAYRSVSYQSALFTARLEQDPSYGQNPYQSPVKVMPGDASEHTTGLALDILNTEYRTANDGYATSTGGKWLAENAHRYGFILRYPKNKEHITGIIFEPWHYRYVGQEAAKEMYESGQCLEEYLGRLPAHIPASF